MDLETIVVLAKAEAVEAVLVNKVKAVLKLKNMKLEIPKKMEEINYSQSRDG